MTTVNSHVADNGVLIVEHYQQEEIASEELKSARLAVCNTCDSKQNDGCRECSCLLAVRTAYKESFCPLGKW
jgi:hypothetical protein